MNAFKIEIDMNVNINRKLTRRKMTYRLFLILSGLFLFFNSGNLVSQGLYLAPGAQMTLNNNAILTVNGDLTIENTAQLTQIGYGNINIYGNWTVNGNAAFVPGVGLVSFLGNLNSIIGGAVAVTADFYDVEVDKDNAADITYLAIDANIGSDLTISRGHFTFENTAPRTLNLDRSLSLANSSCYFDLENTVIGAHTFYITGDITNNGNFDLDNSPNAVVNTIFDGSRHSYVTGDDVEFYFITVDKPDPTLLVEISTDDFDVPQQFLTLNRGIFHLAGTFALTNNFFPIAANNYEINDQSKLWIENTNVTVTGQDADLTLSGSLQFNCEYNVGAGASFGNIIYNDNAELFMEDGVLNVDGRISQNLATDKINYAQLAGDVTVGITLNSPVNDRGMFDIGESSSTFTWVSGTIEIQRDNNAASNQGDYRVLATNGSVTGGLLRIDDQNPAAAEYLINTVQPVGEFLMVSKDNIRVRLVGDPTTEFNVLGSITMDGDNGAYLDAEDFLAVSHDISLGGDWINNFGATALGFSAGNGTVTFNGAATQAIQGSRETTFNNLSIAQTVADDVVRMYRRTTVNGNLRMLTNTLLDMYGNELYIGENGEVYSDAGTGQSFDNKFILNSGGSSGSDWAEMRRYTPDDASLAATRTLLYPLGTNMAGNVYTRAVVDLQAGTALSSAYVGITCVPEEHPDVETLNRSLTKYWTVDESGVTLGASGINFEFYHDASEEVGSVGNYHVLQHRGTNWYVDPGNNLTDHDPGLRRILAVQVTGSFDGDWTAGELDAARAIYYSRQDGDYDDPATWSKDVHGGAASTTAPHLSADVVYIGDYDVVTLTANPPAASIIEVENTGHLETQTYYIPSTVDTFRVMDGGILGLGHSDGIRATANAGNVRAANRYFSDDATYIYNGGSDPQNTGDGLPSKVRALIIEKDAGNDDVNLSNSVVIGDSLVIIEGSLHVESHETIDGEAPGNRVFNMWGGRIELEGAYPNGYSPSWFFAGEIDFNGSDALIIPSGGSTPGVMQYNDLTIRGSRGYSAVAFRPQDTIRIYGDFDISQQNFVNFPTPRFATSGTTIMFNGDTDQDIPRRCARDADWARMNYYNLIIDGTGTKELDDNIDYLVLNNVVLDGATFSLNQTGNYDLTVQGNWMNNGGDFEHQNRDVTFNNLTSGGINTIDSKNEPFDDVFVDGPGKYYYAGNMYIEEDLTIESGATFGGFDASSATMSDTLTVEGDWTDDGSFEPGLSTVRFAGNAEQTIDKSTTEYFYNLIINNTTGDNLGQDVVVYNTNGRNITVENTLRFENGVLDVHNGDRFVKVNGNCEREYKGHVYGPLLMHIPADSTDPIFFPVGDRDTLYRGAIMTFHGIGGGPNDYLQMNQRTQDNGGLHNAAFVNWNKSVAVVWEVTIPSGYAFDQGWRTYDMELFYTDADKRGNPDPPDPLIFVHRRESGGVWYNPPTMNQTDSSSKSFENDSIGRFILGEPIVRVFYSVADGLWSTPETWSLISYGGTPSTVHIPTNEDSVRVGDGITVTMDGDFTVDASRAVVVEQEGPSGLGGRLDCGSYIIDGNGDFVLKSGGALGVGHDSGILADGSDGNIQTDGIDFNEGGHNNGHFIYNGTADQVTGTGLPASIATFTVDNPGYTVDLQSSITCNDSVHIKDGTLDVSISGTDINLAGNWRNAGDFVEGLRFVTFYGDSVQQIYNSAGEEFRNLNMNKSSGTVTLMDGNITVNGTIFFLGSNNANIDSRTYGHAVIAAGNVTRINGHVDGEMRKNIPTGDAAEITYEIGAGAAYTPAKIDVQAGTADQGTAGYVGVISIPEEHPSIGESTFNLDQNVLRYWTTTPYGAFDLGDRPFDLKLYFLYPDDIRNGADYNDFVIRRYAPSSTWTDLTLTDEVPGAYYAHASNIQVMGQDFALGVESPQGIKYYSINDGAWNNPNNWSPLGFGQAPDGTYPNEVNLNDMVYIGDGKTITLDQNRTIGSISVADTVSGMGTLVMGSFYLDGDQFELKSGGRLSLGDPDGIQPVAAGNIGNVRTLIRNYNPFSHNNGHFIYTGAAVTVGGGLPETIASIEFDITPGNTIILEQALVVKEDLSIFNGTFDCANYNITLGGNWLNDDTFDPGLAVVIFNGTADQTISGASETGFGDVILFKSAGDVQLAQDMRIEGELNFSSDGLIVMNQNNVTFGVNSAVAPLVSLSNTRMIQSDGTTSSGKVIKEHSDGAGQTLSFTYPLGIGTDFNKAILSLQADYSSASTEVQLITGPHPNRPAGQDNMLKKYWRIVDNGITNVAGSDTEHKL